MLLVSIVLSAVITAQPLVDADVLEPSVQNEVDHALSLAPTNVVAFAEAPESLRLFCTNGATRTDVAIRLVSSQRADGRWLCGTNDVTSAAVEILKGL